MGQETEAREVFVSVPLGKAPDIKKFFLEELRQKGLIRVAKRETEILAVSETKVETILAVHYKILIKEGYEKTASFLSLLQETMGRVLAGKE